MGKYIKKNIQIEAEQYYKGLEDGIDTYDVAKLSGLDINKYISPLGYNVAPYINTLEGKHYISKGDYIIIGISGERYPCKEEIFKKTYELVT